MIKRLLTALTILASLSTGYVLGVTQTNPWGREGISAVIFTAYEMGKSDGQKEMLVEIIDGNIEVASNE